jgi:hypothetical protein
MQKRRGQQIVYFDGEGRGNLPEVIRVVKQKLKSREELRSAKIVVFTSEGEGPLMAYSNLIEYEMKIIAVTFPLSFCVKHKDGTEVHPTIPAKLKKFFDGVGIPVIVPPCLPFDGIGGMDGHNREMKLVKDAIALFGGGFNLCIQAVLCACDAGVVEAGEQVIGFSGDCAAVLTASTTAKFLTKEGVSINEILCKPRTLTIARPVAAPEPPVVRQSLDQPLLEVTKPELKALPEQKE